MTLIEKPLLGAEEGTRTQKETELDSPSPSIGLQGPLQASQDRVTPHKLKLQRTDWELGSHSTISWEARPTRMVNHTKPNSRALFHRGRQSPGKDICNAKQPSFSQWRAVTQRGLGNPKSKHHPQSNPRSAWDWAFPAKKRLTAREPVAGPSSQSYDSHKSQLGGKMAWAIPTYSLKVQISFSSLHASLLNR